MKGKQLLTTKMICLVLGLILAGAVLLAAPKNAEATDASQVSVVTQNTAKIVSFSVADASLSGKEISVICYTPDWKGNTSDWKNNKSSIAYLNQITLGSDLKYNFVINGAVRQGNYTLVLGTPSGKVTKTFSFMTNAVSTLPDSTVKNLVAEQIAATQVKLTWSPITGTDTYKVFRSTNATTGFTKIGNAKTTEYTDKKAKAGKTYFYKVTADGKNYSNATSVKLMKAPKLKVKAGKKRATLSWKKDTSASGYKVYMSTKKKGKYKVKKTLKKNTKVKVTIKKLKKGKTYFFKVTPYRTSSTGQYSGKASAIKSVKVK